MTINALIKHAWIKSAMFKPIDRASEIWSPYPVHFFRIRELKREASLFGANDKGRKFTTTRI